jgi:prepilin-type N-terminal cleavage/methylation domain-containing protein
MERARSKDVDAPPGQTRGRLSDARSSVRHFRPRGAQRGLTLIECLVTMALVGVVLGIATPTLPRGTYALWGAHQQLLADLRRTRADALTRGDHYRLDVTSANTYAEFRLRLVGTVWVADAEALLNRTLPDGISFTAGIGTTFEFNTRGLLVLPEAAASLELTDTHSEHARAVTVWPSGQVAPL